LNYRAPQLLHDAVIADRRGRARAARHRGSGCGTGLCGELFKPMARSLVGRGLVVPHDQQARHGCVRFAACRGAHSFLKVRFTQFDLAVASDVLNYFGDLREFLAAAAQATRGGGFMALRWRSMMGARDGARATC
jgi:predicted TPR repeat methyltransferase